MQQTTFQHFCLFLPQCLAQKVKYPQKVMIWSVVFIKGSARLYVVNGMMNAEQYKTVLENRLLPRLNDWFPDGNCAFMQDGLHTANLIKNFFNSTGLEVLPWPGNIPDMNSIEGIWHNLRDKVNDVVSTNKRKLIKTNSQRLAIQTLQHLSQNTMKVCQTA